MGSYSDVHPNNCLRFCLLAAYATKRRLPNYRGITYAYCSNNNGSLLRTVLAKDLAGRPITGKLNKMKCGASGDSSRVLLVVYTFRSWEDSAGDAGGVQHLPEHAALGGRLHRHDDAVSQLPATVSCWNTRQGSAGVR